jgi:hypothetical protein
MLVHFLCPLSLRLTMTPEESDSSVGVQRFVTKLVPIQLKMTVSGPFRSVRDSMGWNSC